jgi:hypothetical protein
MIARHRAIAAALAASLIALVLMLPNHPAALRWDIVLTIPLEAAAVLGLLALTPRATGTAVAVSVVIIAWLTTMTLLKLADFAAFTAFGRGFNVAVDLALIEAGARLMLGTLGGIKTAGLALAAGALFVLLVLGLWRATGIWTGLAQGRGRIAAAAVTAGAVALTAADLGVRRWAWSASLAPPIGEAFTTRVMLERTAEARQALADLAAFREAALTDPFAAEGPWLDRLGGRDTLIVFIESYGRASLEGALYAPTHRATLGAAEGALAAAGLAARSGWLTAPIVGGRSWLSHATLAYGLTIPDQTRYAAALASERRTLYDIAAASGFRTAAVMPAITLAWPEATALGFEGVLDAAALEYRGAPFNWVTMPDQFTLAALDRRLLDTRDREPIFAQVALISSHAPWTPIPPLLDWETLGDGRVFDRWALSGEPPEVVWRDRDRVRMQYREAIDYALHTATAWVTRRAANPPLVVLLGDHQPAPFVSLSDSLDVPVHLIGPPELVAAAADWGWTEGLVPAADAPVWPLADFRDRFLKAFSAARMPAL